MAPFSVGQALELLREIAALRGESQQGADHAEAEPSPLLVGDQQVRKLADIAFFIF